MSNAVYVTEICGLFETKEYSLLIVASIEDKAPDGHWFLSCETDLCPAEWARVVERRSSCLFIHTEAQARREIAGILGELKRRFGDAEANSDG